MTAPLCIVVKGFPRISETFITRELEALQNAGVSFTIASLRKASAGTPSVVHTVRGQPNYLPEYLHDEPGRFFRSLRSAWALRGFRKAWRMFRRDLSRDPTRNRVRRFGQACVLATELPQGLRHLHAHFIHTPASVARYAAAMRGATYSVSAHAKDIWTSPEWDLRQKLAECTFASVCNEAGATRLAALSPPNIVRLWPHLVGNPSLVHCENLEHGAPVRFLTVARAVPKKGLSILMAAFAQLPPSPAWSWTHIGGGPLLPELKALAAQSPYSDRFTFLGAQPHSAVLEALARHSVFVLSAIEVDDGDRDGRPNALIEAMSSGLACVASPTGGIPELLRDGAGVLADPEPKAFAQAIARLLSEPHRIPELAAAARARAESLRRDGAASFDALAGALKEASGQ